MSDLRSIEALINRIIPVQQNVGTIEALSGPTATVRPLGSANPLICQISPNLVASAGDRCLIIRHRQYAEWIVAQVFSNTRLGSSGVSPTTPQHAQGAVRARTIHQYTGGSGTVPIDTTTYGTVASLTAHTRSETILVIFNGTGRLTNTSSVESALQGTAFVDDVDMNGGVPAMISRGYATLTDHDASFVFPVKGIPPGTHQIDIKMKTSVTTNTTVYTVTPASFWVMEM